MIFTVNGTDILPYLKFGGIQFGRNDIDGPNAGRGLDGSMIRDRVATKLRWDCTTYPMPLSKAQELLTLLQPEWVTVQTDFNTSGTLRSYRAYSNNITTPFLMYRKVGDNTVAYANEFSFPLIEK